MADPEHVALAKSGGNAIARWRELTFRTPNTRLPRISLGYRLEDVAAGETFLPEYNYGRPGLDLSMAFLSGIKLPGADLSHDDLSGADLTQSDLRTADLSGANLQSAHLWRSNLSRANLNEAYLVGASLGRTNMGNSTLRGANLRGADLSHSDLSNANLEGANLSGADLTETNLSWANLNKADLRGTKLTAATFKMCDMSGADLRGATLTKTDLESAVVVGAVIGITSFTNCDLSTVIGLESVRHSGPSTIALDTLVRSGGTLPKAFLQGAGVAQPLITAQDAARGMGQRYPTVLFVGSKSDEAMAQRLIAGLAASDIRGWSIAADDELGLRSGRVSLGDIVYYDRVLLLCTTGSLENPLTSRYFGELARGDAADSGGRLMALEGDNLLSQRRDRVCSAIKKGRVVDFKGWEEEAVFESALAGLVQVLTSPFG